MPAGAQAADDDDGGCIHPEAPERAQSDVIERLRSGDGPRLREAEMAPDDAIRALMGVGHSVLRDAVDAP